MKGNNKGFNKRPMKRLNKNEVKQGLRMLITWLLVLTATWLLFKGNNTAQEQGMPKVLGYTEFFDYVMESSLDSFQFVLLDRMQSIKNQELKDGKNYSIDYFVCIEWNGEIKNKEASQLIWISKDQINKLDEQVDREAFRKCLQNLMP